MNLSPLRGAPPLTGKSGGRGNVFRCDVATTFLPHNLSCLTSVLYRIFVKKSIARPLVYTSAALRAADKGARNANRPNCPKNHPTRHKKGGFRAKPLAKSRLLFFVFVVGKRNFRKFYPYFRFSATQNCAVCFHRRKTSCIALFTAARLCR